MKSTLHVLSLGFLLATTAIAFAKPAYVASAVNLRAAPNTTSEVLGKIPGGSLVDADNCKEGWCAVTWQDKTGFAIQSALDVSGRIPARRAAGASVNRSPTYVEEPEYVAGPPAYYGPPPVYYYGYYGRPWGWRRW